MERKIKPKAFFELKEGNKINKNNNTSPDIPNIKPKSQLGPQKNHHIGNTFTKAFNNIIGEILEPKQTLPGNNT